MVRRRKKKRLIRRICRNINKINWFEEILKTFVIFCLSVLVLFSIRKNSVGSYEGDKLQEYLKNQINKSIGAAYTDIQIIYNNMYDVLADEKVIITFNKYTMSDKKSGLNISLFERKEKGILEELLGLQPKYKLVFCINSNYSGYDFDEIQYEDWDKDGKYEFSIYYKARYASRITSICTMITKVQDTWQVIQPAKIDDKKQGGNFEICKFEDVICKGKSYEMYGIYNESMIYYLKNPLNFALEVCYVITSDDYDKGKRIRKYMYSMQQYKNKEFVIDSNWNMGATLILNEAMDFENEQSNYWGIQYDGKIYYAEP